MTAFFDARITIHFYWWWLVAYLLVGLVLWLPMEWYMWRHISPPRGPFWQLLRHCLRRRPWAPLTATLAWPVIVADEVQSWRYRRRPRVRVSDWGHHG